MTVGSNNQNISFFASGYVLLYESQALTHSTLPCTELSESKIRRGSPTILAVITMRPTYTEPKGFAQMSRRLEHV